MVLLDDGYDHCHDEPEDMLHALWSCPSISQVHSEVQKARSLFVRNAQPHPPDQTPHIDPWPIWKPPPWPKLKVNFDGVVFREIQCAGLEAVVRNAEGSVLASMAESFHLPLSVVVVEVIAAKKAF
nr:hypothetical protein CFP56_31209 [Quercus suber]